MATIQERLAILETRIAGLQKLVWLLLLVMTGNLGKEYILKLFFPLV